MTPTHEQFKELMTFIKNAQQKEDKINDALKVIWDDEQGQYPPFYISPWCNASILNEIPVLCKLQMQIRCVLNFHIISSFSFKSSANILNIFSIASFADINALSFI